MDFQCGLALATWPRSCNWPSTSRAKIGRWVANGPSSVADIKRAKGFACMKAKATARSSTRLNSGMYTSTPTWSEHMSRLAIQNLNSWLLWHGGTPTVDLVKYFRAAALQKIISHLFSQL